MDLEKIGKYQIVGKIGQGAMGEVFKAHDPLLNRLVAVKTISGSVSAESDARKRFLREAQSAARLNHPNIITVFDLGEDQGRVFMAMELLEGTDLRDLINSKSPMDLGQKIDFMEQVCDGLAYAHAKQVVHRDLKPGNIHVQPSGQVKIMDFGLARLGASEMTATGTVMGTPNYMSPEQVRGEKADARSDIFSLGAVFYELLTSHKAFDADSIHAVLFQVLEHDPQPMRNWAGDVPEILVEVVRRALDKDPVRRFQDAGQLREAVHVARQVFSGEIDEEAGLAALHEVGSAEATVIGLATGGEATVITADPAAPPADISTDATRARKAASIVKGRTTSRPGSSRTGRPVTSRPASRAPAVPAPAPRASRLPLFLGAGVLVLALLAVAAVVFLRPAPAPAPTAPPANVTDPLMVDALVGSLVELANQDLRNKNYASAVKRADSILGLRKDNTEARDIRNLAQGKLDELHAAAQEARQAFEAGDAAKASQFLATVMSIDPSDAVVDELSQKLNRFFQAKAEDARSEMGRSRAAAETAGAARQADFADAVEGARKAEALFKNREYAVATSRYLEASNRFERARNAQVRPTPRPTAIVVAPTLAPAPPTLAPMPPPVVPTAAPAPVTVPSAPPATLALGDEPAIRKVIDDYRRAIESKNLELFRSVKPSLSAAEEKSLRELFKMPQRQQLNLSVEAVDINGAQARVRTSRQDAIDGRQQKKVQQTFNLTKAASGWVIRDWTISQ